MLNGDEGLEEEEPNQLLLFLPTLDQFNLMDSNIDLSLIEQVLEDSRYALSICLSVFVSVSVSLSLSLSLSHYGWSHLCS